jgi:Carboxypeptidase regulatory-like domain
VNKRPVQFLVLCFVLVFVSAAGAQFAHGLGTVAGKVVDEHGKPVADASVTIQTSDGLYPHATHTDVNGHFEFVRFSAGQYDVRASAKGVITDWTKRVILRPKKTTDITLRLPSTAAPSEIVVIH